MSRLSKESTFCSVASTSQEGLEEEAPASASNRTLKVTLLSSEWKSSQRGLPTINRELAIQLAKHPNVEVSVYLPQCSEEDKKIAGSHNVKLIEAEEQPGLEPVLWLASVPENHAMDCVIGHGVPLGRQIPLIKKQNRHCKWIQIVYTAPEDLGMYKSYEEAFSKGEQKHQAEVKLCELADQVVAVGPKLADAFARYLCPSKKDQDVLTLTPGIFNEFLGVEQATEERRTFCVLVFGRGDSEYFKLKGYDIAVQAVAELKDTSYQLMFVGAPAGKQGEVAQRLVQHGIPHSQLWVRCFYDGWDQLASLFREVDLAIMPSRTEGFGFTALVALSAGLPVLVSGNSGLGEALKKVVTGSLWVVESEDPKDWAKKIRDVREKSREVRLEEAKLLREMYLKKFRWQESCGFLLQKMEDLVLGVIPSYVLARGADAVAAFRRALEFGSIFDKRVKVLLIGKDRVGKTSLGKSLKGEPFDKNEPSTDGVQMSLLMRNVDVQPWSDSVLPHNTTVFDHKCALIISEKLRQQTIEESSGKGVEKQTGESMKQVPENSKQEKSEADETGISSHKNEEGKDLGNVHEQEKGESNVVGHTASPVYGNHRGKRQEELNNPSFDYTISDQMSLLIEENLTSEKSIEDEGVWMVIWDFAGQTVYRAIHPLFMSPDAVYVLVSDLTKKLSETSCCHVKELNHPEAKAAGLDSEDSNLDHIMRWIDSVHSLKQSESCSSSLCKSFPPVILVGTHVDKLEGNPEEEKMSMLEELSPVLTKDFTDHITTHSFAIDNTKAGSSSYQEDSEVVALRKHIIDLATEMPHVKKKIPLQWLYVENEVYKRSSQGKKYVTKQTFKDQIVKPFCQFDREDDIEELLHFLYARGTIVYHDCTNSEDSVVVLDPQWLKEVLFQIITAKPNKVGLLKCYQKLKEKGILAEELIDEACKKLELERIKELLIAIMQAFNLIFKWKEEDGKFWYYVPCMLTTTTEDLSEPNTANPGKEIKDRRTTCGLAPIYLTFNTKYVPSGLFCRLVVLFWEWASSRCSSEQPELFANAAKFFIGPVNCIRFVCFKRVIKLRVWGQDYSHPVENQPTICKEILRCLEDYLKKLRKECRWLYSMSWNLCAQCNYKCQEHSLCHWHKIQGCGHDDCGHYIPLQAEPLCCSKASGDCTLLPQDVFEPWIQALNEIKPRKKTVLSKITPASSSTGKRKEPSFPSTGKRKEPSFPVDTHPSKRRREELNDCHQVKRHVPRDEELEFLAREIPDCWIVLGRRLEVEEAQLKAFRKQNDTVSEGAYEMLQHWKKRDASCATYQVLYNALCHELVNRRDLAEKYCC